MALNLLKRSETAGPLTANEHDQNFTDIETEVNAKAPAASPTFTGTVTVPDGSFTIAKSIGLQTALDAKEAIANLGELAYLDVADLPPTYIPTYVEVTAAEVQAGYTIVRDGPAMLVVLPATEPLTAEGTINLDTTTQVDGDRVQIARRDTGPFNLTEGETGLILKPGGDVADFQWSDTASAWIATEDTSVGRRAQIASSSSTLSVTVAHVGTDILHSAACAVGIPAAALQPGDDGRHIQEGATDVITLSATSGAFALSTTPVSTSGAGSAIYWWIDVGGDIRTRFEPADGGRGVMVTDNTNTIVIGPGVGEHGDGQIVRLTHTGGAIAVTLSNDCPPNFLVELILETTQTVTVTPEAGAEYIDAPGSTATAAFVITGDWGARVVSNSDGSSAVYNDYGSTNRPVSGITFGTGLTFTPVTPTAITGDKTFSDADHLVSFESTASSSPRLTLPAGTPGVRTSVIRPIGKPSPIFVPVEATGDDGIAGPMPGWNQITPGGRAEIAWNLAGLPTLSGDLALGRVEDLSYYGSMTEVFNLRRGYGFDTNIVGNGVGSWTSQGSATGVMSQATAGSRPSLTERGTIALSRTPLVWLESAEAMPGDVTLFAGLFRFSVPLFATLLHVTEAYQTTGGQWFYYGTTNTTPSPSEFQSVGARTVTTPLAADAWLAFVQVISFDADLVWTMIVNNLDDDALYSRGNNTGNRDPSSFATPYQSLGQWYGGPSFQAEFAALRVLGDCDAALSGSTLDLDLPLRVLGDLMSQIPLEET